MGLGGGGGGCGKCGVCPPPACLPMQKQLKNKWILWELFLLQNKTPATYFLKRLHAFAPIVFTPPILPLTTAGVIRHECRRLQHDWMSSCNASMTFCNSLLDPEKKRQKKSLSAALLRAHVKWTDWQEGGAKQGGRGVMLRNELEGKKRSVAAYRVITSPWGGGSLRCLTCRC